MDSPTPQGMCPSQKNKIQNQNTQCMIKTYLLSGFFVLCLAAGLQAQNVRITELPAVTQMLNKFTADNKARTNLSGWRIQVLATTDRQKLEQTRQQFQSRYPNVLIDWIHSKPYYKLRAGAYATKLEAMRLKYILERDYAGIYLVKDDNIKPSDLLN